jgi:hypothetical protein
MTMSCRRITPEDQIKNVERKIGRRLTPIERTDVITGDEIFACDRPAAGPARYRARRPRQTARPRVRRR